MRPGQPNHQHNNNKNRMRNRNNNNNRKGPNPLTRSYESNGGDVKIRGTALHVAEKYVQLARDAQSSGDRVAGENYLQHAEHYYRIVAAAQAQMPQPQQIYRNDGDGEEGDDDQDQGQGMNPMGGMPGSGMNGNVPNPNQGNAGGYRDNSNNNYQGNRPPINQQGGPSYGTPEQQPPFQNGTVAAEQQPPFEGGYPQGGEDRGQGGGGYQGNNPGGGNSRHRRRRPYRDNNYNNNGNNDRAPMAQDAAPSSGPDPLDTGGDPSGDD